MEGVQSTGTGTGSQRRKHYKLSAVPSALEQGHVHSSPEDLTLHLRDVFIESCSTSSKGFKAFHVDFHSVSNHREKQI